MDFHVGQRASIVRTIRGADVDAFAALLGDSNPVHLDEAYASKTRFGRRIAHGAIAVSMISSVLGTRYPGNGSIYVSQSVRFKRPVFLDETVTAIVEATSYNEARGLLTLRTWCENQRDELVIDGEALILTTDVTGPFLLDAPDERNIDSATTYV
jgi:3-hydroxybutyryl-CoA dehydratase